MEFTESFRQQVKELESMGLIEFVIIDLASVVGYVTCKWSTGTITSTRRRGIFPTNRILEGDTLEIYSDSNTGTYTVESVSDTQLVIEGGSLVTTTTPELAYFNNYLYCAKYVHDVMFYKMEKGVLINEDQLYQRSSISRREIQYGNDNPDGHSGVSFSNAHRYIESLLLERNYLRGCYLYIITSFIKSCPVGTDDYRYIGTYRDHNSVKINPLKIDGYSISDEFVLLKIRPWVSLGNSLLPSGKVSSVLCEWAKNYGGIECDPEGNIDYDTYPTCDGTKKSCRERGNISRIGLFPGIPKGAVLV